MSGMFSNDYSPNIQELCLATRVQMQTPCGQKTLETFLEVDSRLHIEKTTETSFTKVCVHYGGRWRVGCNGL